VTEAKGVLKEAGDKVEGIKNDDSIPVRTNKKKGLKSKKEVREEVQERATEALKEIAIKHGFISGKWLVFAEGGHVDITFRKLAESLISGPLAETNVTAVRCTTTPLSTMEGQENRYSITVHFPNVYNADEARSLMKHLLRRHGLKLTGVKPDMYSAIQLDSKHKSGIPSTIWKGKGDGGSASLLTDEQIKVERDTYFGEINDAQAEGPEEQEGSKLKKGGVVKSKAKTVREDEEDPFASDGGGGGDAEPKAKAVIASVKVAAPKAKKRTKKEQEDIEEVEEVEGPPKKSLKTATGARGKRKGPPPKVGKEQRKDDSDDD